MKASLSASRFKRLDEFPRMLFAKIERQEVMLHEDYKVYDFNGIVGSVGGSLGLFIGFSFLQMMLYITGKLWNLCSPDGRSCIRKRRAENPVLVADGWLNTQVQTLET